MPTVIIGSDHRGYELKQAIRAYLMYKKYDVLDVGTHDNKSCHYPKVAKDLIKLMNSKKGILICGSGFGVSIAANRHKGVQAVPARTPEEAEIARKHGNINVLCLGADFTGEEQATKIVDKFLTTEFEGGRHSERLEMIDEQNR
tara:strand:- start:278 stop:709 length:432 start_codon:yes stop_codon:yes gene_type:complete